MIILVALVVAGVVSYLVYRAIGPERVDATRRRGPIGPDDDADFLFELDRDARRGTRPAPDNGDANDDPRPGATA